MQSNSLIASVLILLLLLSLSGCADTPTEPQLTEEDVAQMIAEALAEADIEGTAINAVYGVPETIARLAVQSTVYLSVLTSTGEQSSGSGFFIDSDKVATNYHVIEDAVKGTISSPFNPTRHAIIAILAVDEDHDLAIIRVEGYTAPPLALGDSDPIWIGYRVYVIGSPRGLKGTFSEGIISAIRPDNNFSKDEVFQITAAASAGSSGSPVVNISGEVIAIHVGSNLTGVNLHFAIPVNHLKALLSTIR